MQRACITLSLVALCTAAVVEAKLGAPGGPRKLHYDVPDSFEVMAAFPLAVSISDADNDTIFDCMIANRTQIDYEAKKATFIVITGGFNGSPREEIPFVVTPGPTPGTLEMLVGDDPDIKDGIYYYFDQDCLVMDLEYHGHQCVLWTHGYTAQNLSTACTDHFADTCGVVIAPHRRDLCADDS